MQAHGLSSVAPQQQLVLLSFVSAAETSDVSDVSKPSAAVPPTSRRISSNLARILGFSHSEMVLPPRYLKVQLFVEFSLISMFSRLAIARIPEVKATVLSNARWLLYCSRNALSHWFPDTVPEYCSVRFFSVSTNLATVSPFIRRLKFFEAALAQSPLQYRPTPSFWSRRVIKLFAGRTPQTTHIRSSVISSHPCWPYAIVSDLIRF